ncbi:hypothetical protein FGO68_gene7263 [Halteria grandinella]|uniref:Peptidase M20 dimerisation domain-containing protein n=1 Tax=Halteria grandinella TaxID=5974 RepID=A0A8J8T1K9_HALGN|nr:hypothetical protein FGO68_gene7263 [Halteria grandinella]
MTEAGCNIEELIVLRRDIHKHAEIAFKEIETSRKIKEKLLSYGIEEENIKPCAGTGLVVDIIGTGEGIEATGVNTIALRADMDALPIPENNPDLPYKTITEFAHMCGHDGHVCTLLSAAQVMAGRRSGIPKGKKVRLLFQPAEEGPGGALPMIKEGCLEGVDEVYGYHNIPNFDEGDVRVVAGPIMAQVNIVKIKVIGKGGHDSVPHMLNDVISAGAAILNALHTVKSRCVDSKENFVFTLTQFTSGFTYNVFPDEAFMQGTIRSYNVKTAEHIMSKIRQIAENTALAMGCKAEVDIIDMYPPTVNHAKETEHVIRVASAAFGADKVKSQDLPLTASEDFSFFLENRPGCFYMLGIKRPGENYCLHTSYFDYNDSMIASGGLLFIRLVEDRLGAKIL